MESGVHDTDHAESASRRDVLRSLIALLGTAVLAPGLRAETAAPVVEANQTAAVPRLRPRITVLGSGFAALTTVRELRRRGVDADITVISPRSELIYLPSLIWVPSSLRRGEDLRVPLDAYFRRQRVTWQAGSVMRVLDGGRRVVTEAGEWTNDYLVVASGARYLRTLPGIEHAVIPCEGIAAAESIRDRLAALEGGTIAVGFSANPQEPTAVRGGPMFEFLFGIDRLLRRQGRRERFRLVFFNPSAQPGQRLGEAAVHKLLGYMQRQGIETQLGAKLLRFEPNRVVTEASSFEADLILFMPGLTGPAWLQDSDLPRSPGNFIQADARCRVRGLERVFVAGDAGSFPGPEWMPKQAHQADLQATTVAANIAAEWAGDAGQQEFRAELICLVDMLDRGMLIYRDAERSLVLPQSRAFHWAKRYFESSYLRQYR